jgi:hypothetical protein
VKTSNIGCKLAQIWYWRTPVKLVYRSVLPVNWNQKRFTDRPVLDAINSSKLMFFDSFVELLLNRWNNTYIWYENHNNGHETKYSSIRWHMHGVAQIIGWTHPLIYLKQMAVHIHIIVVSSSTKHIILLHISNQKHFTLYITQRLKIVQISATTLVYKLQIHRTHWCIIQV